MIGRGRVWDKIEKKVQDDDNECNEASLPDFSTPSLRFHFVLRGDGDHFLIVQVVLEAGEHEGGHVGAVGAVEIGARLDNEILSHRHWQTCKRPHAIISRGPRFYFG